MTEQEISLEYPGLVKEPSLECPGERRVVVRTEISKVDVQAPAKRRGHNKGTFTRQDKKKQFIL
jgi:hypothetical protein